MPKSRKTPSGAAPKTSVKLPKLIDVTKIDPVKVLRTTTKYPTRDFKSVYSSDDNAVRKDDKSKFSRAIENFTNSSSGALSTNRLKVLNLSKKLQSDLKATANRRITTQDPLFESVSDELSLAKIVQYKPNS